MSIAIESALAVVCASTFAGSVVVDGAAEAGGVASVDPPCPQEYKTIDNVKASK
ncbi:hypothetical protein MASR1M65_07900 [Saprospiraceae bacterium]